MTSLRLATVTLVVPDYDAGITFYVGALGFSLVSDEDMGGGKRWVVVSPGEGGADILLARAANDDQRAAIGKQAGGRVAFFLHTSNFDATLADFTAKGVIFHEQPRREPYGTVGVFSDPFGNRWDLIQPILQGGKAA